MYTQHNKVAHLQRQTQWMAMVILYLFVVQVWPIFICKAAHNTSYITIIYVLPLYVVGGETMNKMSCEQHCLLNFQSPKTRKRLYSSHPPKTISMFVCTQHKLQLEYVCENFLIKVSDSERKSGLGYYIVFIGMWRPKGLIVQRKTFHKSFLQIVVRAFHT